MKIVAYFGFAAFLGSTAYAAAELTPDTQMAFTLKDVFTYCGMVAAVGASWAHAQAKIRDAQRTGEDAERKASATHERMDEIMEMVTQMRLDVASLRGTVTSFADSRFNQLLQAQWSMHEALGKAGVIERRSGDSR